MPVGSPGMTDVNLQASEQQMSYFRFEVPGGEFVLRGEPSWHITFNGIQIGGLYPLPEDAVIAVDRRRNALVPGPDLTGVPNPPLDISAWTPG